MSLAPANITIPVLSGIEYLLAATLPAALRNLTSGNGLQICFVGRGSQQVSQRGGCSQNEDGADPD